MKSFLKYIILLLSLVNLSACASEAGAPQFKMTATVDSVGEELAVTVIEAPHGNSGLFWVIISDSTPVTDVDGRSVNYSSLSIGDTIEITYGGQVMMSYPPKIAAQGIRVLERAEQ